MMLECFCCQLLGNIRGVTAHMPDLQMHLCVLNSVGFQCSKCWFIWFIRAKTHIILLYWLEAQVEAWHLTHLALGLLLVRSQCQSVLEQDIHPTVCLVNTDVATCTDVGECECVTCLLICGNPSTSGRLWRQSATHFVCNLELCFRI